MARAEDHWMPPGNTRLIDEGEMLGLLAKAKTTFLLEPPYRRKYVPLGLAKIAAFAKAQGGQVRFGRHYDGWPCDLVCVTSLFTYDSRKVRDAVTQVRFLAPSTPILLGGVYASLMPKHALADGVAIFQGYSRELETYIPDYDIDWGVGEPWDGFSFTFTSRGCPNRCPYCAVPKLEGATWVNPTWKEHVVDDKPNAMVSDNNLSACPSEHVEAVIDFLVEKRKRVVFDNGFDCKFVTPKMAEMLARLRFTRHGMRLAFDRIEEDGTFQAAVRSLIEAGVPKGQIMAYVLFNFRDTPKEADYRMRECVRLGVRPYPQRFTPLNATSRESPFVGRHWTKGLLRAFRNFWLMAGYYTKATFEEWASGGHDSRMAGKDWEAWRS